MSEKIFTDYKDGDTVWVKLGSSWWPGEVKDLDKIADDEIEFKKSPLVVVKFFDEDTYEYVRSWASVFPYNCDKKSEFIKKGMAAFRSKVPHMEKFPKDVTTAEVKEGGNPNILSDPAYCPEKKRNYVAEVFGTPSPKKVTKDITKKARPKHNPKDTAHITHRRFLGLDDYKAYICIQYPEKDRIPGDSEDDEVIRINTETEQDYNCHICSYTTTRLEVMVLHTKSHLYGLHVPTSKRKRPITTKSKKKEYKKKVSKYSDDSSSDEIPTPKQKKRKTKESIKKINKISVDEVKPKPVADIRNDLLAEWDDSEEENSLLDGSSKHSDTFNTTGLSKIDDTNDFSDKDSSEEVKEAENEDNEEDNEVTEARNEDKIAGNKDKEAENEDIEVENDNKVASDNESDISITKIDRNESLQKMDKETQDAIKSCFDFDEDDEEDQSLINTSVAIGRKIPRVIPPTEKRKSEILEDIIDLEEEGINKAEILKESQSFNDRSFDKDKQELESAFNDIMDTTSVPKLPDLQNTLKPTQNFHSIKTIKFPDKSDEFPKKDREKDLTEKPINPKKRFVKSFADFEEELKKKEESNQQKIIEEAKNTDKILPVKKSAFFHKRKSSAKQDETNEIVEHSQDTCTLRDTKDKTIESNKTDTVKDINISEKIEGESHNEEKTVSSDDDLGIDVNKLQSKIMQKLVDETNIPEKSKEKITQKMRNRRSRPYKKSISDEEKEKPRSIQSEVIKEPVVTTENITTVPFRSKWSRRISHPKKDWNLRETSAYNISNVSLPVKIDKNLVLEKLGENSVINTEKTVQEVIPERDALTSNNEITKTNEKGNTESIIEKEQFSQRKLRNKKNIVIEEPVIEEPVIKEPVIKEPVIEEPVVEEPVVEEPVVGEPIGKEPLVEEPVVDEPLVDEPVIDEPVVDELVVDEPVVEEPMVEEPVVEEPVVEAPVVEEPVIEEPVVEEPVVEEPVVEEPVVEEPVVEEPVVKEPVVEEPVVKEPVVEEPVVEEPVVEEPVVEEPVVEEVMKHAEKIPVESIITEKNDESFIHKVTEKSISDVEESVINRDTVGLFNVNTDILIPSETKVTDQIETENISKSLKEAILNPLVTSEPVLISNFVTSVETDSETVVDALTENKSQEKDSINDILESTNKLEVNSIKEISTTQMNEEPVVSTTELPNISDNEEKEHVTIQEENVEVTTQSEYTMSEVRIKPNKRKKGRRRSRFTAKKKRKSSRDTKEKTYEDSEENETDVDMQTNKIISLPEDTAEIKEAHIPVEDTKSKDIDEAPIILRQTVESRNDDLLIATNNDIVESVEEETIFEVTIEQESSKSITEDTQEEIEDKNMDEIITTTEIAEVNSNNDKYEDIEEQSLDVESVDALETFVSPLIISPTEETLVSTENLTNIYVSEEQSLTGETILKEELFQKTVISAKEDLVQINEECTSATPDKQDLPLINEDHIRVTPNYEDLTSINKEHIPVIQEEPLVIEEISEQTILEEETVNENLAIIEEPPTPPQSSTKSDHKLIEQMPIVEEEKAVIIEKNTVTEEEEIEQPEINQQEEEKEIVIDTPHQEPQEIVVDDIEILDKEHQAEKEHKTVIDSKQEVEETFNETSAPAYSYPQEIDGNSLDVDNKINYIQNESKKNITFNDITIDEEDEKLTDLVSDIVQKLSQDENEKTHEDLDMENINQTPKETPKTHVIGNKNDTPLTTSSDSSSDITKEGEKIINETDENSKKVEVLVDSSPCNPFKFSIQTNLSNLSRSEEISAIALATLSELKTDSSDSNSTDIITPKVDNTPEKLTETEMVAIESNLTIMSERDLVDKQVEITSENITTTNKKPVTLSNFSMDFSDSTSDNSSLNEDSKGTEFTAKAMTKELKPKVIEKKINTYDQCELLDILEGNSDSDKRVVEYHTPTKTFSDDLMDFEECIPSQVVCTFKHFKEDMNEEFRKKDRTSVMSTTSKLLERLADGKPKTESKTEVASKIARTKCKPIILSEQIIKPAVIDKKPAQQPSNPLNDIEDVEAFVIHKDMKKNVEVEEQKSTTVKTLRKPRAKPLGKAKILQQTIITPAGEIIQPATAVQKKKVIVSPVVTRSTTDATTSVLAGHTSKQLESTSQDDNIFDIFNMPIVLSDQILTPESLENMPIVIDSNSKSQTVIATPSTKPSAAKIVTKIVSSNTPTLVTNKPSGVVSKIQKPRILQNVGSKTVLSTALPSGTKPGKYIIVSHGAPVVQQKLGPKKTLLKKSSLPLNVGSKTEITGNKIMVMTNQQGQQQRLLLTPAQQKVLGYQSPSSSKVTKTIVKTNILQSVLTPASEAGSSKGSSLLGQKMATTASQVLTTGTSTTGAVKIINKTKPQTVSQRLNSSEKTAKTILIRNKHGQTIKKIATTEDDIDKQVAEQLEAIKASSGMQFASLSTTKASLKLPARRPYINKKQETKKVTSIVSRTEPPPLVATSKKALPPTTTEPKKPTTEEVKPNTERPLNQLVIQDALGNQTTITEGQILALPSETVDGQPQSYMLVTLDQSGNLTPLNNEALMSLDPNLGLGGDLSNMVLQIDQGSSGTGNVDQPVPLAQPAIVKLTNPGEELQAGTSKIEIPRARAPVPLPVVNEGPTIEQKLQQSLLPTPVETPMNIESIVGNSNGEGQQLIVTGDPIATQKFLESLTEGNTDLANIIANAEGKSILIQADGQQILINTNSDAHLMSNLAESSEGDGNPTFATQPIKNTDILAAALADTDVFTSQPKISSQLSPNTPLYPMNVGNVLETSLTLGSPIMTPLEVPSINNKKIPDDEADILTHEVPKNVDLPITITDPNISQTVANQQAALLANELHTNLELGLGITETVISSVTTGLTSPGFSYSLPTLDDEITHKPFSSSMPLLNDDLEDASLNRQKTQDKDLDKAHDHLNPDGFLEEESRFTLGGGMCSSLSEPPPEMFDIPDVNTFGERNGNNIPLSLQSTPDPKDDDTTDVSLQAESSSEGSCEIPLQPKIVAKSVDLSEVSEM